MKEIGGYFGLEQLDSNEYYKDLIDLNSGRNALLYILKSKKIKKLYIPFFLCNSIKDILKVNGYDFEYYFIDCNFLPKFNKKINYDECLYIVNYYGQITDDKILRIKERFGKIIVDNTQAFFQKPVKGIDTFYSCRKFFGVPDGAYVYTDEIIEERFENDISGSRMNHLLGRYEENASNYFNCFKKSEEEFKNYTLKKMSKLTHNILGAINYKKVKEIRENNYIYLDKKLGKYNKLKLNIPEGPFSYPLYINNGYEVKEKLARKKIYIATLWPNVLNEISEDTIEHKYVSNILPLPCDQRYGLDEMIYLINEVEKYI